jgi:NAD(P)-dependent dehydrogenase (short-subunit alcohol dehydrogenase family)
MLLSGRLAVVTGGSSGIGRAIAVSLRDAGARVFSADVSDASAEGVVHRLCDVSNPADVQALYQAVAEAGSLRGGVLVLNAGVGLAERLDEGDPEKWARVINVNLVGTMRVLRAFLPDLLDSPVPADVIFVSSVAAFRAFPYGAAYAASKAGLEMVAESLRLETLGRLRVTVINPGMVETPLLRGLPGLESVPAEEVVAPEQVAEAALFALQQPTGASINRITIRPTGQEF